MKHSALAKISGISAVLLSAAVVFAAEEPQTTEISTSPSGAQPTASPAPAPKLAYGVDDVVKLTRAQVSEDVIATYIQSSGSVYNLKPSDILELHKQGVSDKIVTLMLSQGHLAAPNTNQPMMVMAPGPVEPVPVPVQQSQPPADPNGLFIPGQNAFEVAAVGPPAVVEPASSLYVIPDSRSYGYRPVYTVYGGGCYTSYGCAPSVIRIGGSYHGGYHHYRSFRR